MKRNEIIPMTGSGTLYIKKEGEQDWILLAEGVTITVGLDPKIHKTVKRVCRFRTISYDSYHDALEEACHHPANIPRGTSWGECCPMSCPLAVEREMKP